MAITISSYISSAVSIVILSSVLFLILKKETIMSHFGLGCIYFLVLLLLLRGFIPVEFYKIKNDEMLKDISSLQELNMRVRDSLFDKRRAMTSLLKSDKIDRDIKQNLTIVLKDLNSLVEFSVSQLNVLDNIQTILASQVNIEQNKIIKLFTVATVAMMPPTLIGTIYGMNFKFMPELELHYAYPIVLAVMIISIIVPVIVFKKKGWL